MNAIWILITLGIPALLSFPLGKWMARVLEPELSKLHGPPRFLRSADLGLRTLLGKLGEPQTWKQYCVAMAISNGMMFLLASLILALQHLLPLNPDAKGPLEWSLIFHTIASFVTNTNSQHYSGEVSLSYLSQMFALMWLQFVSAATGISAATALCRALAGSQKIGNFYLDLVRSTFFILLPLAAISAILLALGGVPMTWEGSAVAHTLEGISQTIARGPVAAFVAIKQLGTNGGGFLGSNSAHPFENPTLFTNMLESMAIVFVPMATVWMFGWVTRKKKEARLVFSIMGVLLLVKIGLAVTLESAPTTALESLPVAEAANLEGKELRFGADLGATWGVLTTATSNGSVNSMLDSFNPLTGLVPLTGMWLNMVFGGVGVGFINFFLFLVVAVFISGLMVGRTPELFGKKIEADEMKLASLAILIHPMLILGGTALFAFTPWGAATVGNPGSHGFTEILYEITSSAANNGSGFEGLGDNTLPWNLVCGCIMILGRYLPIFLPLAIGGALALKKTTPITSGTLPTHSLTFGVVMTATVMIIGALLFLPVAVLGPVTEFLLTR
jgi:K+-transporting ATPase ATPase A chain